MAELEGLYVSLGADTSGLDRGMRSAEQSVNRAERAVTTSLGRMDQAMGRFDRSVAAISQRLGQFAAVAGIAGIGALTAKTVDYAEAWTQVGNRLRLVSQDAAGMKATQEHLFQAAQKAGVSLSSVVDVYSRAAQAAGELGASQEQLTRFSGGVAQALAVSGTSADAAAGAMQQLGQLLGSTRVQAEEFNSILDGAPRVAKAVADGLTEAGGSVSRLKQLITDGKVSNKQFFDAFLGQIPKIQAEFDTAVPTIGRALTTLDNAMGKLIGEANEAAGATTALARGLTALGNNLDSVVSVATQVALALGGIATARMVPAGMASLTRAIDDQKTALYAKAVATAEAANAEKLAAAQALMSTQRTQVATAATLRAVEAEFAGKAAVAGTAASNLAAAEASLTQAKAKTSLTTNVYVLNRALAAEREAEAAVAMARSASITADGEKVASLARLRAAQLAAAASGEAVALADAHLTTASVGAQAASVALAQRVSLLSVAWGGVKTVGAGLLALVGGPWNAAMLAGGAAALYLATRTTDAEKAQESYNRVLTEGRQRVQEMATATREQANALLEKQRNEVAATQAAASAAAARVATLQSLVAEARENADTGGTAGLFSNLFGSGDGGVARLEAQLAAARKEVAATAAALDGMQSVGQKTGDAIGLEMASKLSRGTAAFNSLNTALGEALKQAGLTIQSGKLMTNEQAETEKATATLGRALQAGSGFLRTYGTDADQVSRIMAALKLKIDPVASAIADMNREIAQLGAAEGAARSALTTLQQINQQREKEGKAPFTTVSPEYLQLLDKAKELETQRVQAATNARAKVLDLDKQIAKAQGSGNATLAAELTRQKAVEEMVGRGVDRKVAEKNAEQDYAVAIAGTGAAAGQAAKEILLAADAQMVMARAAGLGEAATRQAAQATRLAQEAAKANGNVAAVQAANRREEAAAIVSIRNETVRGLELETANTNALTLAMAAGGEAVRVAQEEEYKLTLIRKLGADATVAGTEAQKALNDALAAYRKNRAANDNNRLEQAKQTANDNLALAQRELDLMGQAEPVRERALTTLRNQQEATRKVAELGADGAKQWLDWQEQIADKRAMIDYLKSVQATAKEISGDIFENLYDRLMDPSKATSAVDFFKGIFKRIAVAALETNVVMPIVTQVVGSVPGLFGIASPATAGQAVTIGGLGGGGNSLSVGNLFSKASGGWLDRQLGGGITSASNWLNSPIAGLQELPAGMYGPAAPNASIFGNTSWGDAIGGGLYGVGALTNFANGNVAGGIGNSAAAIMSFIPGLQEFAPIAAIAGQLLGGLFGQNRGTPTAAATVTYRDSKQVASAYDQDNEGDLQQAQQLLQSIDAATSKFIAITGGKTTAEFGIGAEAADGKYKARTLSGELSGSFDTLDKAVIAGFRKNIADGLIDVSDDVRKAVANSTKTDINEFMADVSFGKDFRAQFDAMNSALDPTNNQIKTYTENAKKLGEQVKTSILDWKDTAKELALATDEELVTAARRGLTALMGLGPAVEPLRGIDAVTRQANIEFEAFKPALVALGYTAAEQSDLLTRYTDKARQSYQDAVAYVQRQGAASIAALIDPLARTSGLDRLQGLGLDRTSSVTATLAGVIDNVEAAARRGALTMEDERGALAHLDAQLSAGYLTAEQYTTAVGYLTQAWQDSATAAERAAAREQARQDLIVRQLRAEGHGEDADGIELVLKQAREMVAAIEAGYDEAYLSSLRYVQGLEQQTAATQRAAQVASYTADLNSRMWTAVGNTRSGGLLALDQQQAAALAEARANGYDVTQLQQVQAAERAAQAFTLAQQDVLAAYDQQISAQQELVQSLQSGAVAAAQTARQFRQAFDNLAINDNSPLNALGRLEEARNQFQAAYVTASSDTATEADKTAALSTLQSLGPTLVQLARAYYGSTDTTDYNRVREVYAEFADLQGQGLDTADRQLETANRTLTELQRQRAEAASMGQRQYGALTDLKSVMDQSYAVWQQALGPLQRLTSTTPTAPHYSAPANVQTAWDNLSGSQQSAIAQAMGWGGSVDEAFNIWLATSTDRAATFGGNVTTIAGGAVYAAPDDVGRAWEALTGDQRLAAVRTAGYGGAIDEGLNAWVKLGHQAPFESAVRAQAHSAGIPGFAAGGVIPHIPGVSTLGRDSMPILGMPGEGVVNLRGMSALGAEGLAALNAGRWPANDRWGGTVTAARSPAGSTGSTASLERRLDRAMAVLERILGAIEDGDADNAAATGDVSTALTTLARQLGRTAGPVGQRRTANG